jgi:hypothetical protein
VLLSFNDWLGNIFPAVKDMSIQFGIPVGLIPVVVAAAWQITGFTMAMYLAGMATISGIFQFTHIWNDFLFGVTILPNPNAQPVTVAQKLAPVFDIATEPNQERARLYESHYRDFLEIYPRLKNYKVT